jgi:16S rRNA (cytidine1402-2'-O)-methyltransferase
VTPPTWRSRGDDEPVPMGLSFVPTPLGNLRDLTLRAIDVLQSADVIVAEDTRVARRLLSAHGIAGKPLWSYREQNAAAATESILARAREGHVAVVADAGMPGISDPGVPLIAAARAAGIAVDLLPGPTAFACAAVLSGFDLRRFAFEGFPPRVRGARRAAFSAALARGMPSVWYESPHRIRATLDDVAHVAPQVRVFVLREFTKLHEQQVGGFPADVAAALPDPVRGEIVLVVDAGSPESTGSSGPPAAQTLDARIDALLASGASTAAIAKQLAAAGAGERRELYARITARRTEGGEAPEGATR